jgi:hypothetical protein
MGISFGSMGSVGKAVVAGTVATGALVGGTYLMDARAENKAMYGQGGNNGYAGTDTLQASTAVAGGMLLLGGVGGAVYAGKQIGNAHSASLEKDLKATKDTLEKYVTKHGKL